MAPRPSKVVANFDAICALVAAGSTLIEALTKVGVKKDNWASYLHRNPDYRRRYSAGKPATGRDLAAERFDDVVAAIEAGDSAIGAIKKLGLGDASFYGYVRETPGARERLVAAAEKRGRRTGRVASLDPQRRWTEGEYDAALEAISNATAGIKHVLTGDLPPLTAIEGRLRRDSEFRARFRAIMYQRAKRLDASRKPKSPTAPWGHLTRALRKDDLYRRALAVCAGFDPNDRDDAVSTLYLAVLEGEIADGELKKNRKLALRRALGDRNQLRSLDALIYAGDDTTTLAETVANPDPILFY